MPNDDLILILDDSADITLIDDIPYADHHAEYEGEYVVTPILHDDQVLETNDKIMRDDVTVRPIPVVYTSNPYDGKTVVIG